MRQGGGDPEVSLPLLPLRSTQTQGFPPGISPGPSSGPRVHSVTCIISKGSVLILSTYKMSGSSKPSASQPRQEMEVSLFAVSLSPALPFAGELNVFILEGPREAGTDSNTILPR